MLDARLCLTSGSSWLLDAIRFREADATQRIRLDVRRNGCGSSSQSGNSSLVDIQLRIEDAAFVVLAGVLFVATGLPWWWLLILFIVPDVSILGYALGPGAGAIAYNIVHSRALAIAVYLVGLLLALPLVSAAGALLLFHASVDRVLGFGLKYSDSFQHTHLGRIGRRNRPR